MKFCKLPSNAEKILDEILASDNPSEMLCAKFKCISRKEDEELRGIIKQLREEGYINVKWADNVPYYVTVNNAARSYKEHVSEYKEQPAVYNINQSITIGDGNTFKGATIASKIINKPDIEKKTFYDKHPVICGFLISLIAGVVLLFSFWEPIIKFIEGVF